MQGRYEEKAERGLRRRRHNDRDHDLSTPGSHPDFVVFPYLLYLPLDAKTHLGLSYRAKSVLRESGFLSRSHNQSLARSIETALDTSLSLGNVWVHACGEP